MTDRPLDPRFEKLVALLYGELTAAEERSLREEIARDPALEAAWQEISSAHEFLQQAPEAPAPKFVVIHDPRPARRRPLVVLGALAPWAAAAAAIVVALFAWNEARLARSSVERASIAEAARAPVPAAAMPASSPSNERSVTLTASIPAAASSETRPQYMTREEFEAYSAGMMRTMTVLLDEYGKRRDKEFAGVLQVALNGLAERQTRDYGELKGHIDDVAQGLVGEQFRTNLAVEYLMREGEKPAGPEQGNP